MSHYQPSPHQPQPPPWAAHAAQPAAPPKRRRRWPWVVGAIVAVLFAVSAVAGQAPTPTQPAAAPPQAIPYDGTYPSYTPTAEPAQSGPLTEFSDGTYEVGNGDGQVPPGKYKSPGPGVTSGGMCYSARLKTGDGAVGDIIDNNIDRGPSILNVGKSDGFVKVTGCTFTKA
jgi:hypothetical protein